MEILINWFRRKYIKTMHWEYWPIWVVYMPVSFYYIYLSLRAKSFFFFSASNPLIENGGMFFESKWLIFQQIPRDLFPTTIFVSPSDSLDLINSNMLKAKLSFPIIAKPDRGERGWLVKKIYNASEFKEYKEALNITFLIQSYVNLPVELSVFYYRHPNMNKGIVTSLTFKKLLTITGNGSNTIKELICKNERAFLQYQHLKQFSALDFNLILEKDRTLEIVPYGNHALGAMFINYNHLITPELVDVFDNISKRIQGFCFGRYDIRCSSLEDLIQGKNLSILELNGAGAEPAHIYDPNFSFWKAQSVLADHYRMMFDAAIANHQKGVDYMTYQHFKKVSQLEKKYKKNQLCF